MESCLIWWTIPPNCPIACAPAFQRPHPTSGETTVPRPGAAFSLSGLLRELKALLKTLNRWPQHASPHKPTPSDRPENTEIALISAPCLAEAACVLPFRDYRQVRSGHRWMEIPEETAIVTRESARPKEKTGRHIASGQWRAHSGHEARLASLFEQFALVNYIDVGALEAGPGLGLFVVDRVDEAFPVLLV